MTLEPVQAHLLERKEHMELNKAVRGRVLEQDLPPATQVPACLVELQQMHV